MTIKMAGDETLYEPMIEIFTDAVVGLRDMARVLRPTFPQMAFLQTHVAGLIEDPDADRSMCVNKSSGIGKGVPFPEPHMLPACKLTKPHVMAHMFENHHPQEPGMFDCPYRVVIGSPVPIPLRAAVEKFVGPLGLKSVGCILLIADYAPHLGGRWFANPVGVLIPAVPTKAFAAAALPGWDEIPHGQSIRNYGNEQATDANAYVRQLYTMRKIMAEADKGDE